MHQIKNRFFTATVRLTAWYLAVLMITSLVFSMALYQTASQQVSLSAREQATRLGELSFGGGLRLAPTMLFDLSEELQAKSQTRLRANLVAYNLIILVAGGAASFWFARRTLRPIESALAAQTRFTADASHELRTPLTAMRSEIEVALRDTNLSMAEAREQLESNLEEIEKLEQLSQSLLQLARYEDGNGAIILRTTQLRPLVEKTVAHFSTIAASRRITLHTKVQDIRVDADTTSLRELLTILLDNAVKYSKDGGEVTIRTQKVGTHVLLSVEDQGVGIKASQLPHVFERFYRADDSRSKTHAKGYGLGLSIAKSIVKAHHGTITVKSSPGHGSQFLVKIPLKRRAAEK